MDNRRVQIQKCEIFHKVIRENFLFYREVQCQPYGKAFLFLAHIEYCLFYGLWGNNQFLENVLTNINYFDFWRIITQKRAAELDVLITKEPLWNALYMIAENFLSSFMNSIGATENYLESNLRYFNGISGVTFVYISVTRDRIEKAEVIDGTMGNSNFCIFVARNLEADGSYYVLYPPPGDVSKIINEISAAVAVEKSTTITRPMSSMGMDNAFTNKISENLNSEPTQKFLRQPKNNETRLKSKTTIKISTVTCNNCKNPGNLKETTSVFYFCLPCSIEIVKKSPNRSFIQGDSPSYTRFPCCAKLLKHSPLTPCKKNVHFGHKECMEVCKSCLT